MIIDINSIFDELVDYSFHHLTEVKAVVDNKVKCIDGELIEFIDPVDDLIFEYDEVVILAQKTSSVELKSILSGLEDNQKELIEEFERRIRVADKNGFYLTYAVLVNDVVEPVVDFSF